MDEIGQTFSTEFHNRRKEQVSVFDSDGAFLASLLPGDSTILESVSDRTLYAPYESVTYRDDGTVDLKVRPKWVDPYIPGRLWKLTIENIDGKDPESRIIGGKMIVIPRGVPVNVFLAADDPLAQFEKIRIQLVEIREKSDVFEGYYVRRTALQDIPSLRGEKELGNLEAEKAKLTPVEPVPATEEPIQVEKKRPLYADVDDKPVGKVGPAQDVDPALRHRLGI